MTQIRCIDITQLQPGDYERLYEKASPERKKRADRYLRQEDSIRCIVAEALLRLVPGFDAGDLDYTEVGKPYFKDHSKPHFNLSHSGRWVVIAWGDSPLGIDVEQIQMDAGKEAVARRFYRSDEQAYVFSAEGENRARRFYRVWTMKESYLKYLGTGITVSLNSFSALRDCLGVTFSSEFLPDACMTLCASDDITNCRILLPGQLMAI